jgi:uncharacterized membrane protein
LNTTQQRRVGLRGWTIPLAYALATLIVGMGFPRLECSIMPGLVSTMSAPAAMSICSAIASGMIAMTGIVFSLAFVMVQFSASAYSPRLVLWVARDPVVPHALGVFSATFLYALMLLAWVDRGASGKVPLISAWFVFVLLLASMGMFIALIERVGRLQVNRMLVFVGGQGRKAIDEFYPAAGAVPADGQTGGYHQKGVTQTLTHLGPPQVIQAVHMTGLVTLAKQSDAVIEMAAAVGDTLLETMPVVRVYGARHLLDESALKRAIDIGDERTFEQDPKYALRLLVDIAIKALSPAINDPTTAVQALDQIEDLLLRLGSRCLDVGCCRDEQGTLRVVIPVPTWDDFLRLALDETRFCGASSVQVMRRMKALTKNLLQVLPPERCPALQHWEQRLQDTIGRTFADAEEKEDASVADRQGLGLGEKKPGGPGPGLAIPK